MTPDSLATIAAQAQTQPPTAFLVCLVLTIGIVTYHITTIAIGANQ